MVLLSPPNGATMSGDDAPVRPELLVDSRKASACRRRQGSLDPPRMHSRGLLCLVGVHGEALPRAHVGASAQFPPVGVPLASTNIRRIRSANWFVETYHGSSRVPSVHTSLDFSTKRF